MKIQKTFQAGNSQVVAIPKALAREIGLEIGHKVVMEKTSDNLGFIIKRADEGVKKASKKKSDVEFQSWITQFMEENGETLDELAIR